MEIEVNKEVDVEDFGVIEVVIEVKVVEVIVGKEEGAIAGRLVVVVVNKLFKSLRIVKYTYI